MHGDTVIDSESSHLTVFTAGVHIGGVIAELDCGDSTALVSHPSLNVLMVNNIPDGQLTTQVPWIHLCMESF
jgi:hypothetical protein